MKIIGLYRYTNPDGSISITPEKRAKTDIENQYRLIADEGKVITDGKETYYCIDTHNVEQFTEIPIDPTPEPETDIPAESDVDPAPIDEEMRQKSKAFDYLIKNK